MLRIEELNINDNIKCLELIKYAKNCSFQSTGEFLAEILKNNELQENEKVIVAYSNDSIIGFAGLFKESVAENFDGTPYLDFLFVEEGYRNRGIATKLVDKIIEQARENYKVLYLVTVSHEAFYKKLGFETIVMSKVIGCIDDCFIMKKNI